jgi:transcriptional regulator with XRE-family HTH domain
MEKTAFNKALGIYIRKVRLEKGLTQQMIADKMGLDFQYISRIERGLISPTLFWLSELSKALDCKDTEFYNGFLEYKKEYDKV